MQVAAAGLGSVAEQREWTDAYWLAVIARLPRLEAQQNLRAASVTITPSLWRHAYPQYQKRMAEWQAIAESAASMVERGRSNLREFKQWFRQVLGSKLREG